MTKPSGNCKSATTPTGRSPFNWTSPGVQYYQLRSVSSTDPQLEHLLEKIVQLVREREALSSELDKLENRVLGCKSSPTPNRTLQG